MTDKKLQASDDSQITELGQEDLQNAAGGSVLGDIENAADDVGHVVGEGAEWAYNHPGDVAIGAGVVAAGAMAGVAAASVLAGQGTVALAAGMSAAAGGLGAAAAGAAEGVAHGIEDGVDDLKKIF